MNYTITLTEKQLVVIQNALEEYERLRLGQAFEFASDICEQGVDLTNSNPNREKAFDLYIERRNAFKSVLETLIRDVAFSGDNTRGGKTQEMLVAEDIWRVIRHFRWEQDDNPDKSVWCVAADEPYQWSNEPLPKIEQVREKNI